jgi:hypothetical protein
VFKGRTPPSAPEVKRYAALQRYVKLRKSHATCHTSHVTRHTSHVTCHPRWQCAARREHREPRTQWFRSAPHRADRPKQAEETHVTRHTSHLTPHMSHVTRYTSHLQHFYLLLQSRSYQLMAIGASPCPHQHLPHIPHLHHVLQRES